jgi:hypothetical protein
MAARPLSRHSSRGVANVGFWSKKEPFRLASCNLSNRPSMYCADYIDLRHRSVKRFYTSIDHCVKIIYTISNYKNCLFFICLFYRVFFYLASLVLNIYAESHKLITKDNIVMKTKTHRLLPIIAALLLMCVVGQASATLIGPGLGGYGSLDTDDAAGRLNIDDDFFTLAAGDYQATTFSFDAGADGPVTAFLASSTDGVSYVVLALSELMVTDGLNQSLTFGGTDLFSLIAETNVYAGIATFGDQNPILFTNSIGTTDHDNLGSSLAGLEVGDELNGFTNANLGRQYHYEIEVGAASAVAEPSIIALFGLGLVGLGFARRRKA